MQVETQGLRLNTKWVEAKHEADGKKKQRRTKRNDSMPDSNGKPAACEDLEWIAGTPFANKAPNVPSHSKKYHFFLFARFSQYKCLKRTICRDKKPFFA